MSSVADPVESDLLQRFSSLITSRTGLRLRDQDIARLSRSLLSRVRKAPVASLEDYRRLLESGTPESEEEWQRLVSLLTNGESYFFRDRAQMRLLKETILPEIIRRNSERRTLRLWSAGCSTGEEAYSLAILLQELLPDFDSWKIYLQATDVDVDALESARRGRYRAWSFRSVDPTILRRHFEATQEGYCVNDSLRRGIVFRYGNLFRDPFTEWYSGSQKFDLILCRNVFIYFDAEAVGVVLRKFTDCLNDDGWLMTGHAELHGQVLPNLTPVRYPESVVYRRPRMHATADPMLLLESVSAHPAAETPSAPPTPPIERKAVSRERRAHPAHLEKPHKHISLRDEAEACVAAGSFAKALALADRALSIGVDRHWALLLSARILADTGRHEDATKRCLSAIECEPTDAGPYILLAHIAEERGDTEAAKQYLRKVIFLSPGSGEAYRHLADLCEREGATARARTLRTAAQEALAPMTPETASDETGTERPKRLLEGNGR